MVYLNFFRSYFSQKMEFSVNDFFSKFEQIRRKLFHILHQNLIHLTENTIFCTASVLSFRKIKG